jgi:hypothetical protein
MKPVFRRLYLFGVVAFTAVTILMSVQTARADWPIPPGCTETSYVNDCGACGPFWIWQYWRHTWKWRCPDGTTGIYQEKGPCQSC